MTDGTDCLRFQESTLTLRVYVCACISDAHPSDTNHELHVTEAQ